MHNFDIRYRDSHENVIRQDVLNSGAELDLESIVAYERFTKQRSHENG